MLASQLLKRKLSNFNPWLTSGIKISCTTKRYLYVKNRHNKDPNCKAYYKKYCKILSSVIREAKKNYYDSRIQKANNKAKDTWDIIKTITNNNPNKKRISPSESKHTQQEADAFNLYFSKIAEQLMEDSMKNNSYKRKDPLINLKSNFNKVNKRIKLKNTTTHEIGKIIRSLKTKDSHGYGGISTRILKLSAPYIVSPLTFIIKRILLFGTFPN